MSQHKEDVLVDTLEVSPDKLSGMIHNFHELGYLVRVYYYPVEGDFGKYKSNMYVLEVFKPVSY